MAFLPESFKVTGLDDEKFEALATGPNKLLSIYLEFAEEVDALQLSEEQKGDVAQAFRRAAVTALAEKGEA